MLPVKANRWAFETKTVTGQKVTPISTDVTFVVKLADPKGLDEMSKGSVDAGEVMLQSFKDTLKDLKKHVDENFYDNTLDWDYIDNEEEFAWFIFVDASVYNLEKADKDLQTWVNSNPNIVSGYTEYLLSRDDKSTLYCHMRNLFADLPIEILFSCVTPDEPWVYTPYAPYAKTYTYTNDVSDDWVEQQASWKPVVAMHALANERYADFAEYISTVSGEAISSLPKSWLLKAFNINFETMTETGAEETIHQRVEHILSSFKEDYDSTLPLSEEGSAR